MGQCKNHPLSTSGDGVCPSCLQKKLKSVWWSETVSSVDAEKVAAKPSTAIFKLKPCIDPAHPKEARAILGSIVSIQNRNHRGSKPGMSIIEAGLDFRLDSRYADGATKPLVSSARVVTIPALLCPPSKISPQRGDGKDRKRWLSSSNKKSVVGKNLTLADSKPLVDRIAKETALRVIREVKYDMSVEGEGEELEGTDVAPLGNVKDLRGFSPSRWQSKWRLKGIVGSSMTTSSNKVFPSKPPAETRSLQQAHSSPARGQSRANIITIAGADLQPASGDRVKLAVPSTMPTQEMVIVGMPDRILKPEDMNQRLRTSYNTVLQWLQDLPVPDTLLLQKAGDPGQDPYLMDLRKRDLAVVGQLHGIAEEHESLDEESSEESEADRALTVGNNLDAVSSFGKFLIRAAQRQPKQGLSRVQARTTALTAR